jgi:hypothetical protein
MSTTPTPAPDAVPSTGVPERRRNAALRKLIDEMLFQVRGLQRENEAWTPDERARAEAELQRIMGRVRDAAVAPAGDTDQSL